MVGCKEHVLAVLRLKLEMQESSLKFLTKKLVLSQQLKPDVVLSFGDVLSMSVPNLDIFHFA